MSHADKAIEYYSHNFNCSQGIFATYAVENGFDEKMALKLGTNFGGGSRKGEMCGAVAGALMVIGLLYGHFDGNDLDSMLESDRVISLPYGIYKVYVVAYMYRVREGMTNVSGCKTSNTLELILNDEYSDIQVKIGRAIDSGEGRHLSVKKR